MTKYYDYIYHLVPAIVNRAAEDVADCVAFFTIRDGEFPIEETNKEKLYLLARSNADEKRIKNYIDAKGFIFGAWIQELICPIMEYNFMTGKELFDNIIECRVPEFIRFYETRPRYFQYAGD